MKLENLLDSVHSRITSNRLLQIFTATTRLLLFVGFMPPGLIKVMNKPFTVLPDTNPVGHYFNALYQTGAYYQFIGWSQVIAAVLLIFPRTAHFGALLFLPIIVNIAVLTNAVGFKGTWLVTIFMMFAATWLVAWDYDRIKPALFGSRSQASGFARFEYYALPVLFGFGGAILGLIAMTIRLGNLSDYGKMIAFLTVSGGVFGFVVALHHRFMRSGAAVSTST